MKRLPQDTARHRMATHVKTGREEVKCASGFAPSGEIRCINGAWTTAACRPVPCDMVPWIPHAEGPELCPRDAENFRIFQSFRSFEFPRLDSLEEF